jgi:hypothetical protein
MTNTTKILKSVILVCPFCSFDINLERYEAAFNKVGAIICPQCEEIIRAAKIKREYVEIEE